MLKRREKKKEEDVMLMDMRVEGCADGCAVRPIGEAEDVFMGREEGCSDTWTLLSSGEMQ